MNDPMLGTDEEQAAYKEQIQQLIEQDLEQRRQQRMAEFLSTRESPAVIQGAVGTQDSLIQSLQ